MEHTEPTDIRVTPSTISNDLGAHRTPYISRVEEDQHAKKDMGHVSALILASYHVCKDIVGRLRNNRSDICEALAASSPPEEVIQRVRRILLQRRIGPKEPIALPETEEEKEFAKVLSTDPYRTQCITKELIQHIREINVLLDSIAEIIRTEDSAVNKVAKMTDLVI